MSWRNDCGSLCFMFIIELISWHSLREQWLRKTLALLPILLGVMHWSFLFTSKLINAWVINTIPWMLCSFFSLLSALPWALLFWVSFAAVALVVSTFEEIKKIVLFTWVFGLVFYGIVFLFSYYILIMQHSELQSEEGETEMKRMWSLLLVIWVRFSFCINPLNLLYVPCLY